MRGDFSRVTFRPEHHYSGVRLQQGRVLLDAEFNEEVDIQAHRHAETARDLVGPHGAPYEGGGFRIGIANQLRGVHIQDEVGWAVGADALLLQLDGDMWKPVTPPAGTGDLYAVHLAQSDSGHAVGAGGVVLARTETSWTREALPGDVRVSLYGVAAAESLTWAVGESATIMHRRGDGSWIAQSTPEGTAATLRDVSFCTASRGWAVGDGATILATTDGTTWKLQQAPPDAGDLHAVFALDVNHVWAAGDGGTILFWNGTAWARQQTSPGTGDLRAVRFLDDLRGTAVGDDDTVLVTSDGGATAWTTQPLPGGVRRQLRGLHLDADGNAYAVGVDASFTRLHNATEWHAGPAIAAGTGRSLTMSAGDLYVDGVRVVNEQPEISLTGQPDLTFSRPPDTAPGPVFPPPSGGGTYGVYLEVFEDHVTALERAELREVALGGPDTATRTRSVWQAKLHGIVAPPTCAALEASLPAPLGAGRLRARAEPGDARTQECSIGGAGGYRGLENQLYRVEVHDVDEPAPTFVWSRDNGMTAARLEALTIVPETATQPGFGSVTVSHPGRDEVLGFGPRQWVELSDETRASRGIPGVLVQIRSIQGNVLEIEPTSLPRQPLTMADFPLRPTARRWDGSATVEAGRWHVLEDGIEVQFAGTSFRTGDHWLIAARSATGTVEWPTSAGLPLFQESRGPRRRFAPLALVDLGADGLWSNPRDCRRLFPPLTGLVHVFYVGGDGQQATPDLSAPAPHYVKLDQPLRVGVSNWRWPVAGAQVRFEVISGDGRIVDEVQTSVTVQTGADGIAACDWYLNGTISDDEVVAQVVRATLLDGQGLPVQTPILFNASVNVAAEVAYDGHGCGTLGGRQTVQSAINTMSRLTGIFSVTGTGIDITPGRPADDQLILEVVVVTGCGPAKGATVDFVPEPGSGSISTTTATTDDRGRATTLWTVDAATPTQRVMATLNSPGAGNIAHLPNQVTFVANLSLASETAYSPTCEILAGADTVQKAIDGLARLPRLFHVSGDGAHAAPGELVGLEIGVTSDCGGDLGDHLVAFAVQEGDGTLDLPPGGLVPTAGGRARCDYRMGSSTRHLIEARLIREGGTYEPPVLFTVTRVSAGQVSYDPGCDLLKRAGVDNVQDAITALCQERERPEGLRLRFTQELLTNVEDPAGRWQYESGQVFDSVDSHVGEHMTTKRIIQGPKQNSAMLTVTIFFFSETAPPENLTCQGAHSFDNGDQNGSVSAASTSLTRYIGSVFSRVDDAVTIG